MKLIVEHGGALKKLLRRKHGLGEGGRDKALEKSKEKFNLVKFQLEGARNSRVS